MSVEDKVKEVIEQKIRPGLMTDGGNIEFLGVDDGIVKVKLQGSCAGCPMKQFTLINFVENTIKQEIPEIKQVMSI